MSKSMQLSKPLIGVVPADDVTRFDRVEPEVHLALPAHPTVKQQLEYYSRYADTRNEALYLRLWHAAQALIVEWECEALPDYKIGLDEVNDPQAAMAIMWAGNVIMQHMTELESLPKV